MGSSVAAVGVKITLPGQWGSPLVHLHPATLDDSWALRCTPPYNHQTWQPQPTFMHCLPVLCSLTRT